MRGSYVDHFISADGGPVAVADALRTHLAAAPPYAWVIPGDDHLLRELASRATKPWAREILPVEPDETRVAVLGSKLGFARGARKLGLPVPQARECVGLSELQAAFDELGGALMLKEDCGSGGDGCRVIEHEGQLRTLPPSVLASSVLAQEYLRGLTYSVEGLYNRGRLSSVLTSRILRVWPALGPSTTRHFAHHAALVDIARNLGSVLGLHGFANISFVTDRDDQDPKLIELDPRPNALFHIGDRLGVGMTESLRELVQGLPAPKDVRHVPEGTDIVVPVFPLDVLRCVFERDVKGAMKWAVNWDGRWGFLPERDWRLMGAYGRYVGRRVVRRMIHALAPETHAAAVTR